ncbi:hypothetical protein CE167_01930 [Bifidobacterium breve]|nr:hypothetical protein CE167_01930 [Bifidobacterium breve]
MAKRDAARCRIPLFGLLRCCVAAGRRQSDVVMCSTSQRTPSTSGAQLAFEPYQCAQCRAKHDAYGAVENNGQRKRGEHEDPPPEKGRQELPAHPTAPARLPQLRRRVRVVRAPCGERAAAV